MSSTYAGVCPAPVASVHKHRALQITVAAALALGMALYFWTDSRYPALLKKLNSGKSVKVTAALTFDAKLPVSPEMPLATRVGLTTLNWMWANRIGMTFGVCFGAAALTLLPLFSRRRFSSAAGNTLMGAALGTPLGVCANCVAPIGQGLISAGASRYTALATMISSPLLNVVVLAMAFTLFPLPIALTRLAIPLVLLALVPLIGGRTPGGIELALPVDDNANWPHDISATLLSYLKNLARLAAITLPLMLVAALLGSVVAELLPAHNIPATASLLGIIVLALIGTFLPVPMAFDVAAAFVLMSRGVPLPYVVTLLCTLGAFSIYPMLIVGRSLSWRTAAAMFGAVACLGIMAGVGTSLVQGVF
jgi:uncharacterized membrane protein YraQ (UPF0718 family)